MKYVAGCLLSAVLGGLFTVWLVEPDRRHTSTAIAQSSERGPVFGNEPADQRTRGAAPFQAPAGGLSPEETINVAVYEKVNRSVVNITTKSVDSFLFTEIPAEGTGSGAVLDTLGHVLTNYHVIQGARQVVVTLYDGTTHDASFVGADPEYDLAVIKIDAPAAVLHPVELGDSSRLQVGMRVFAIGNPFGLERTMTTGIISSLNRSLQVRRRTIKSIIQIDAAINPGNSGGPLLDSHGRVIGVNTAIASRTGQSSGVGFVIPVNLISRVVPQLVQHGRVLRPEIGIQHVFESRNGLLIEKLTPGGPAERAGLRGPRVRRTQTGPLIIERIDRSRVDLIIAVDNQPVKTADDFLSYIESKKPGDRVVLTIIRDGKQLRVPVTLGGGDVESPTI